jgi:hypothetical protein
MPVVDAMISSAFGSTSPSVMSSELVTLFSGFCSASKAARALISARSE